MITGDDHEILKGDTPASRRKVALFAMSIMLPTLLWFILGALLISKLLNGDRIAVLLTGVICAITIFIVDRSIIMSNGGKAIAVFRIILALSVSLIGATVIDEIIFKNDIDQHLEFIQRQDANLEMTSLDAMWNERIAVQEKKVETAHRDWDSAVRRIQFEVTGIKGTGRVGYGSVTKALMISADQYRNIYEQESEKLDTMKAKFDADRSFQENKIVSTYNDHSLLKRIDAMFRLIGSNNYMLIFYLLFTTVFILIECIPLIIKLSSAKTNYERMIELSEEIGVRRMNKVSEVSSLMNERTCATDERALIRSRLGDQVPSVTNLRPRVSRTEQDFKITEFRNHKDERR
jgi:hypothetical protein